MRRFLFAIAIMASIFPRVASAQATWCVSSGNFPSLAGADNMIWADAQSRPHPTKWARYLVQPSGCHQERARQLMGLALEAPSTLEMQGRNTGQQDQGAHTFRNGDQILVEASHLHTLRINFGVPVAADTSAFAMPDTPDPLVGRGLYIRFRCNWDPEFGSFVDFKESDGASPATCDQGNASRQEIAQIDFDLRGTLAPYFSLVAECWELRLHQVDCNRPASAGLSGIHAVRLTVKPKKVFLDYFTDYRFADRAIGAPARWSTTGQGGNLLAIVRNNTAFATPVPLGYRFCQTEGVDPIVVTFKPWKAGGPEPDGVKMQKGQCLEVDAPTQIVLRAQGLNGPEPGGYYQMFARGTFKPQGEVVPLPDDGASALPASSVPPAPPAQCTPLPKPPPGAPQRDYYSSCRVLEPLLNARSVRMCFEPGYAPHGASNGRDYPGGFLRMILEQKFLRQDPEDKGQYEWQFNYLGPIGCRDLFNVHVGDVLVGPRVPENIYDPAKVDILRFTVAPLGVD